MNDDYSWLEEPTPEADQSSAEDAPRQNRSWRRLLRLPRLRIRRRTSAQPAASQPSAADLLSGQAERPLTDLDERLQSLRARSSGKPAADSRQELFDVDDLLTTPSLQEKPGGVITAVALSRGQQQQVDLLTEIVSGQQDAPQTRSLLGRGGSAALLSLRALPRLLVAALLLLFVALPFVSSDYAPAVLPPADFPADDPAGADFFRALDGIAPGNAVLVAVEYGLGAAAELDPLTDLALRHIFARGGRVILATSNPIAFVHAQTLVNDIRASVRAAGLRLEARRDFALLRYLPGGALGLRELSENFRDILRLSYGDAAPPVRSLDDLALILLIAESADDVRNWAEQVLPETSGVRLYAATSLAAEPLARAWVDSVDSIGGLVAGMPAAFTYGKKLESSYGVAPQPTATPTTAPTTAPALPTLSPTTAPTDAPTMLPTALPTALPTLPPTVPPAPTDAPTIPPPPTNAPTIPPPPTDAPAIPPAPTLALTLPPTVPPPLTDAPALPPTLPPVPAAAAAAAAAPTATATPALVRAVEVVSLQSPVNIRTGPGTTFETMGLAYRDDIYEALEANSDSSWYKIRMANGWEGWIAAILVEEKMVAESALSGNESASAARARTLLSAQRPRRYSKTEPRFAQVSLPGDSVQPGFVQLRERQIEPSRLQALTMGTIAAVLAIVVGNLVALFGAFGRRK